MMGYDSAENLVKESRAPQEQIVRLAEVASLDTKGRAKVKFFGEDTVSRKTYTYIDGYVPKTGDKVAMIAQGNTFIIIGAVVETGVIVKYALVDHVHEQYALTTEVALKNHTHDDYAAKKHSHSDYADADHTHDDYADADHTHSTLKGANRSILFSDNMLIPDTTKALDLGSSSRQYRNFYAQNVYVNGTAVSTSDKRKKKFIRKLNGKYLELFKKLRPVTFKYKDGTSGRAHAGFIAQEVEQAMKDCGISNEEFGGLVIQDNGEYGLRYEEFIALQTAAIQDLQKHVEELERRVKG